jgi:hypothetical protein
MGRDSAGRASRVMERANTIVKKKKKNALSQFIETGKVEKTAGELSVFIYLVSLVSRVERASGVGGLPAPTKLASCGYMTITEIISCEGV